MCSIRRAFLGTTFLMVGLMFYSYANYSNILDYNNRFLTDNNEILESYDLPSGDYEYSQQQEQPQRVLIQDEQDTPATTTTTSTSSTTSLRRHKVKRNYSSTSNKNHHSSSSKPLQQQEEKKDKTTTTTTPSSTTSTKTKTTSKHSSTTDKKQQASEQQQQQHQEKKREEKPSAPSTKTTTKKSSTTTEKKEKKSRTISAAATKTEEEKKSSSTKTEEEKKSTSTNTTTKKSSSTTEKKQQQESKQTVVEEKNPATNNSKTPTKKTENKKQEESKQPKEKKLSTTTAATTTTTTTTTQPTTAGSKTKRSTTTSTATTKRSSSKTTQGDLPPRLQLLKDWNHFNTYRKSSEQGKKFQDYIKGKYLLEKDVILSTHTSVDNDKLKRVDILQKYWQGPISLAVRIRSEIEINKFFDYFEELPTKVSDVWTIHFVFENALAFDRAGKTFEAQYCHNALRNLAMHSPAIPDYVLYVDLDFFPTYGGYPKLMAMLDEHPSMWNKMKDDKTLFVIPVMEVLHIPKAWGYSTKTESRSLIGALREINSTPVANRTKAQIKLVDDLKKLEIFEKGVEADLPKSRDDLKLLYKYGAAREWHHRPGHAPTNLLKYWKYKTPQPNRKTGKVDSNAMSYRINRPSYQYEPYFIGYKPSMPKFWESFRGYGLNKQAFVRECILAGFGMEAVFELYLTHLAHPSNNNKDIKKINEGAWDKEFQHHLEINYEKPKFDPKGEWWYADPTWRPDRHKYVTKLRQEQYGD